MTKVEFFEIVTGVFEILGVLAMAVGVVVAVILSIRSFAATRGGRASFTILRNSIGLSILLGLEILVAADLVRTVTSTPSLTDVVVLAIIVLIRTVLSFSLQVEIEGVAPWRRAMMTAPELMVRSRPARPQSVGESSPPAPSTTRRSTPSSGSNVMRAPSLTGSPSTSSAAWIWRRSRRRWATTWHS